MALPTRMAGSQLPNMSITWTDDDGIARTLSGTITANMTNMSTGVTRAATGSLIKDVDQVTNKGVFVWDLSAADVTAGLWTINFIEVISSENYYSLTEYWSVANAPTP